MTTSQPDRITARVDRTRSRTDRHGRSRATAPAAFLVVVLLATAMATGQPGSQTWMTDAPAEEAGPAAPENVLYLAARVDLAALARLAGPELAAFGTAAAARELVRHREAAERWLCDQLRKRRPGLPLDACPAGGVLLSGPDGVAQCSVHAHPSERANQGRAGLGVARQRAIASGLSAVERVEFTVQLDGNTLRPDPWRGYASVRFSPGSGSQHTLGLDPARFADALPGTVTGMKLDVSADQSVHVKLTGSPDLLRAQWAPAGGPVYEMPWIRVTPESREFPVELALPIGLPMWRLFEARMPGGVGLGRPPVELRVFLGASTIEVRVRHVSQAAVLNLDSNLSMALSVLKVASAFRRKDTFDQVLEYLFRAPRRLSDNELVIEGPWPPELKGGLTAALENAVEHGPATTMVVRAACRMRRLAVERAVAAFEAERGAALSGSLAQLVDQGFVDHVLSCPDGIPFTLDDGEVRCQFH